LVGKSVSGKGRGQNRRTEYAHSTSDGGESSKQNGSNYARKGKGREKVFGERGPDVLEGEVSR